MHFSRSNSVHRKVSPERASCPRLKLVTSASDPWDTQLGAIAVPGPRVTTFHGAGACQWFVGIHAVELAVRRYGSAAGGAQDSRFRVSRVLVQGAVGAEQREVFAHDDEGFASNPPKYSTLDCDEYLLRSTLRATTASSGFTVLPSPCSARRDFEAITW